MANIKGKPAASRPGCPSPSDADYAELLHKAKSAIDESRDRPNQTRRSRTKLPRFEALTAAIDAYPSFGLLRRGFFAPPGGRAVHSRDISRLVVECGISGWHLDDVIKQLCQLGATRTCKNCLYFPLNGLSLTDQIDISEEMSLVPWNKVPESDFKTYFERRGSLMDPPPANAAIRFDLGEHLILHELSNGEREGSSRPWDAIKFKIRSYDEDSDPYDLVRCLTSLRKEVTMRGWWFHLTPAIATKLLSGFSPLNVSSEKLWRQYLQPAYVDDVDIAAHFNQLRSRTENDKQRLRIGLDRLARAMSEGRREDKAIDIGIALEVMLGVDKELQFRISLRGSGLLGGNREQRKINFEGLKRAYTWRSKAVHSGRIGSDVDMSEAIRLCAGIAAKLIEEGSPDWGEWEKALVCAD